MYVLGYVLSVSFFSFLTFDKISNSCMIFLKLKINSYVLGLLYYVWLIYFIICSLSFSELHFLLELLLDLNIPIRLYTEFH